MSTESQIGDSYSDASKNASKDRDALELLASKDSDALKLLASKDGALELLAGICVALNDRIRSVYTCLIMHSKKNRGPLEQVVRNYESLRDKIADMYNNFLQNKDIHEYAFFDKLYNKLDTLVPGWRNPLSDLKDLAPLLGANKDRITRAVSDKVGFWGNSLVPRQ